MSKVEFIEMLLIDINDLYHYYRRWLHDVCLATTIVAIRPCRVEDARCKQDYVASNNVHRYANESYGDDTASAFIPPQSCDCSHCANLPLFLFHSTSLAYSKQPMLTEIRVNFPAVVEIHASLNIYRMCM